MVDSVYKIIELVGTSTESWEKAAGAAVAQAAKSLRDLRAAQDHGVNAFVFHAAHDSLEVGDCFGPEDPGNQLLENDAIDFGAFRGVRPHVAEAARGQLLGIDLAVDQIACPEDAEPAEAELGGPRGDHLRDMQPGQGRASVHPLQPLVERLAQAAEEIIARFG